MASPKTQGFVRIGISGWRYAPWRGRFSPRGLVQREELAFASRARISAMFATLTSKGQITLPKEIRDQLGLDAGSMLDFEVLPDNTITARLVKADARRIRGLLKSPHAAPLTVAQMDEGISRHLRKKHAPLSRAQKQSKR